MSQQVAHQFPADLTTIPTASQIQVQLQAPLILQQAVQSPSPDSPQMALSQQLVVSFHLNQQSPMHKAELVLILQEQPMANCLSVMVLDLHLPILLLEQQLALPMVQEQSRLTTLVSPHSLELLT